MDDPRDPAQDGQADVDEEVGVAARLEEDGEGGQEDCQEVEADVRGRGYLCHFFAVFFCFGL